MSPISLNIQEIAKQIKLVILDVDGVLTNGQLLFLADEEYKAFHAKDGLGLALLIEQGVEVAVISGNQSTSVERRLKKFKIKHIYQGSTNKVVQYHKIIKDLQLVATQVAYMGDDLIDLPVMSLVGLPTVPADADPFVKTKAKWQSNYAGGQGAVRELCELILEAKGTLSEIRDRFVSK